MSKRWQNVIYYNNRTGKTWQNVKKCNREFVNFCYYISIKKFMAKPWQNVKFDDFKFFLLQVIEKIYGKTIIIVLITYFFNLEIHWRVIAYLTTPFAALVVTELVGRRRRTILSPEFRLRERGELNLIGPASASIIPQFITN